MKTKIILGVLILAALCIGFIFFWPLSFADSGSKDANTVILYTDLRTVNSVSKNIANSYTFPPGSVGSRQIQQILSKYSFHRSLRTIFSNDISVDDGNDPGYWLMLYTPNRTIRCGRVSEIIVNDKIYRIGYWGDNDALSMTGEIINVLDNSIPDQIK